MQFAHQWHPGNTGDTSAPVMRQCTASLLMLSSAVTESWPNALRMKGMMALGEHDDDNDSNQRRGCIWSIGKWQIALRTGSWISHEQTNLSNLNWSHWRRTTCCIKANCHWSFCSTSFVRFIGFTFTLTEGMDSVGQIRWIGVIWSSMSHIIINVITGVDTGVNRVMSSLDHPFWTNPKEDSSMQLALWTCSTTLWAQCANLSCCVGSSRSLLPRLKFT